MSISNGEVFIGIDLGGTNVRVASITGSGHILKKRETAIEAARGPQAGLEKISTLISKVIGQTEMPIKAIGIGSTGPLDRERGCIQNPYTLPGWEDVDIVRRLQMQFGVPVALENDADAAALGEAWIGAGKDVKRLAMVTIGTGVGTAFIYDGEIYRGTLGAHPEGGHILIDPNGPACYCGAHGCWESLVSGPAIAAHAAENIAHSSYLLEKTKGDLQLADAALVFAGAWQGDPYCSYMVDRIANFIGLGLVTLMMLYLPDCIVLGGGVLRSYDIMESTIKTVIDRHNVIIPANQVKIRFAGLGQHAGLYGAIRAAQLLVNEGE
ncbi:MAG: glucokinase [Chloroflexi bacterium HGW-Chloroflexi-10]|nr:MAG: glucokinase [Chloroflexi bacterium HGW-Chloroflexi-10]